MNCQQTRDELSRRFDEGEILTEGLELHLASCEACHAYHDRLDVLLGAMGDVPVETPSPWLAERLRRAVATPDPAPPRALVPASVFAVLAALVALGWRFPLGFSLRESGAQLRTWFDPAAWQAHALDMLHYLRLAVHIDLSQFDLGARFPMASVWIVTSVTAAFLIVFNWIETATPGSSTRRAGETGRN